MEETLLLAAGSGAAVLLLGIALAWCVSMYDFTGKRVFEILLILPLARILHEQALPGQF
ncbi:MAG: hypothetical protein LBD82_04985 [Deltaproteobacteria bacterium]|jgi:iron(III) transport system permease protein|nr:hypothetical protein [Deltaproteobacteria bacterium]